MLLINKISSLHTSHLMPLCYLTPFASFATLCIFASKPPLCELCHLMPLCEQTSPCLATHTPVL